MAVDRICAELHPLGAPARRPRQLPRGGGAVGGVSIVGGEVGVEADVVQERRHGENLAVDHPAPVRGDPHRDVPAAQAMALHRTIGSAGGGAQPLQCPALGGGAHEGVKASHAPTLAAPAAGGSYVGPTHTVTLPRRRIQ